MPWEIYWNRQREHNLSLLFCTFGTMSCYTHLQEAMPNKCYLFFVKCILLKFNKLYSTGDFSHQGHPLELLLFKF